MKNEATDDHIKTVVRKRKHLRLFDTKLNRQVMALDFLTSAGNHFLGPINPHNLSTGTNTLHNLDGQIPSPTANIQHRIPHAQGKQVNHPFAQLLPTTKGDASE